MLQLLPKGTGRAGANTPNTGLLSTQHAQHTLVPTCQVADFTESHILSISFLSPEATDPILEAHGTDIRAVYRSVLHGPHGIISKYSLSSWHLKLSRFYIKLWTYSPSWKRKKQKQKENQMWPDWAGGPTSNRCWVWAPVFPPTHFLPRHRQ